MIVDNQHPQARNTQCEHTGNERLKILPFVVGWDNEKNGIIHNDVTENRPVPRSRHQWSVAGIRGVFADTSEASLGDLYKYLARDGSNMARRATEGRSIAWEQPRDGQHSEWHTGTTPSNYSVARTRAGPAPGRKNSWEIDS